jgi:hypothetical protein
MKMNLMLISFLFVSVAQASQIVTTETINVDGVLTEKAPTDQELENVKAEIRKQQQETVLNREKAKGFQQLSKSVESLSVTTEEYIIEKKETQKQIAEYNEKVRCMQDEYPGHECDKYLKKTR